MVDLRYLGKDTRHHESSLDSTILQETKEVMFDEAIIKANSTNITSHVEKTRKSHSSYRHGPFRLCWSIQNETVHFTFATNITQMGNESIWSSVTFSRDKVLVKKHIS